MTGCFYGEISDSAIVGTDNSTITNSGYHTGGLIGYAGEDSCEISDCKVENISVNGTWYVGGIAGTAQYGTTYSDCEVKSAEIDAANDVIGLIAGGNFAGNSGSVQVLDCTVTESTAKANGQEVTQKISTSANTLVGSGVTFDSSGKVTGGLLEQVDDSMIAAGLEKGTVAADGTFELVPGDDDTAVAKVGHTYYTSLEAAFAAAGDGDTVTLVGDIILTGPGAYMDGTNQAFIQLKDDKDITLDLNGHTLTMNEIAQMDFIHTGGTRAAIEIYAGSLTVQDSGSDGKIAGTSRWGGGSIFCVADNGKLILESGTLSMQTETYTQGGTVYAGCNNSVVRVQTGGAFDMEGGTIETTDKDDGSSNNYSSGGVFNKGGVATLSGGTITTNGDDTIAVVSGGSGKTTISGTEITSEKYGVVLESGSSFQMTGGKIQAQMALSEDSFSGSAVVSGGVIQPGEGQTVDPKYIQPGMKVDESGNIVINTETAVAKIGDVGYGTLATAIAAAKGGDTVTMLKAYDATSESTITLNADKDITLDLGGYALTLSRFNLVQGQLTVENGSVECAGQAFNVYAGPAVTDELYTKLVIADNITINAAYGICLFPEPNSNAGYSSAIEVYGKIESGGIFVSGNLGNDTTSAGNMVTSSKIPTITIYEGAVVNNGTEGQGIAMNGLANVTVNGGTVSGSEAIGVKRGTLTVNGGTFLSNGEYVDPAEANNNGTENTGATISITSTYNYAGTINVNLNGGTFTSENAPAVYQGHSKSGETTKTYTQGVTLNIQGGTFTSPDNTQTVYVADKAEGDAESYTKKVVSGGTFSTDLSESGYLADSVKYEVTHQAGGFSYTETLAAAQALAQSGDTITDLKTAADNTVTLTLNYNDGGATANVTYNVASSTSITLPTPARSGYTFTGWSDGTTTYDAGDEYTVTSNATLTAQWRSNSSSSGGGVATYAITVPSDMDGGTVKVSPTRASSGTKVTITTTPAEGYQLDKLTVTDGSGKAVSVIKISDTEYTFIMPASKVEIAASFREILPNNAFTDIYESNYYYDAVLWAVENGVTNGTSATTFSPNVTVSRAQMVTFLWRAHGSPKATGTNPFTDVSTSDYYYDAVLWAVANGVTNGTSATTFSPEAPVTRAQAVTFQWRAAGSPTVSGNSFDDVAATAYYANAVIWAVANGVTNGTGGNNFSPEVAVSRAQAVTFLWRELG